MTKIAAFGIGMRRKKNNLVLDVTFIHLGTDVECDISQTIGPSEGIYELSASDLSKYKTINDTVSALILVDQDQSVYADIDIIAVRLDKLTDPVKSAEEAYLKLHLISHRLVKPHGVNLDGAFGQLTNVAWTSIGPVLLEDVPRIRMQLLGSSTPLIVTHVDKFPYLVNYHIPSGVRIASGSQVRLGAYLGEGTTVMPAGYVNFNAGTLGNAMVEGRVSAGVVVGNGTDVGGGASIMGTLSGGNDLVISIGPECLLGANSGVGISLGNGCTVEAGLYITAGKKVTLVDHNNSPVDIDGNSVASGQNIVKGIELSGRNNLLFIQDSRTGEVICKPNTVVIELNEQLHQN